MTFPVSLKKDRNPCVCFIFQKPLYRSFKVFFLLGFGGWGRIIIIKREKMYERDSAVAE